MYTRGQFAVIGKVGRKALRIYDEEGLLVPAAVNGENGYHYYDESQLVVLEKIKSLWLVKAFEGADKNLEGSRRLAQSMDNARVRDEYTNCLTHLKIEQIL